MSALWIELKKGFTNEGVVHELSWIPGVQTGGVLCSIYTQKGIDLGQKKRTKRNRFPFFCLTPSLSLFCRIAHMQFLAIKPQKNYLAFALRSDRLVLNVR